MIRSALACACFACATAPEVERSETPLDLSGEWNDVDADLVARQMIDDCLSSRWPEEWAQSNGRKPLVRLEPVRNRTDGYIDYRYFTKQLEAALLRSNRVEVRTSVEEERSVARLEGEGEDDTRAGKGDFVLDGWILSQDDEAGGTRVRAYLTSLELTEIASKKKAWIGQKRIRKIIRRDPAR